MVIETRLGLLRHGVVAQFITYIPWNMGNVTSYLPTQCKALQKYSLVLGLGHPLCCNTDTTKAQHCTWAFAFTPVSQLWVAPKPATFTLPDTNVLCEKAQFLPVSHMNSFPFLPQSHGKHKSINALVVLWHYIESAAVTSEQPSIHSWAQMCLLAGSKYCFPFSPPVLAASCDSEGTMELSRRHLIATLVRIHGEGGSATILPPNTNIKERGISHHLMQK